MEKIVYQVCPVCKDKVKQLNPIQKDLLHSHAYENVIAELKMKLKTRNEELERVMREKINKENQNQGRWWLLYYY